MSYGSRPGDKPKKKLRPHENRNKSEQLKYVRRIKKRVLRERRESTYHFPHNHKQNPHKKKRDPVKIKKARQVATASRKRNRR